MWCIIRCLGHDYTYVVFRAKAVHPGLFCGRDVIVVNIDKHLEAAPNCRLRLSAACHVEYI